MQITGKKAEIFEKIEWSEFHDFSMRHIGPDEKEQKEMLKALDLNSLDGLIAQTVPESIRQKEALTLAPIGSESEVLLQLKKVAGKNRVLRSFIGLGFYDTIVPPVIQRNVLENPGWYTQYTPYQAEIAQGRLEAILNFQTLVTELTGLPVANASLLDEATACAEAMAMGRAVHPEPSRKVFAVSSGLHPQNIEVIRTRARPLGIEVELFEEEAFRPGPQHFACIFQYPESRGGVRPGIQSQIASAKAQNLVVILAADPLALLMLKSPGALGADIAVGSMQRFGVPMGFGGPSAAYLACRDEFKRNMPGRIVGLSKDLRGKPAIRLALQTREQHIRREKATSNICTSQVLLAVMASMYAVYHGPRGLLNIAKRTHGAAILLARAAKSAGFQLLTETFFDTITLDAGGSAPALMEAALREGYNLRREGSRITIALDEALRREELEALIRILSGGKETPSTLGADKLSPELPEDLVRDDAILTHPVFNRYHSEHEMLRYLSSLEKKDLSLNFSMIPLGSCTMKLNATVEMIPVTWPEFGRMHPAAPADQTQGYRELFKDLEAMLAEVTGFDAFLSSPMRDRRASTQASWRFVRITRAGASLIGTCA